MRVKSGPLIRHQLPKKGRGTVALTGEPKLPLELEGARQRLRIKIRSFYSVGGVTNRKNLFVIGSIGIVT